MLLRFIQKLFLTLVTLSILTVISYHILLRDPIYAFDGYSFSAYFAYLQDLINGDWGISENSGEPLLVQILRVFPATLALTLSAILLSLFIGIPLAFVAVVQRKNLFGKLLLSIGSFSLAVPVFWLAVVLLDYASMNGWSIAAVGEIHPIYEVKTVSGFKLVDIWLTDSPHSLKMLQSALQHLALPTLVLAVPATLETMRFTAERAEYVLEQNYVKVARSRGWSPFQVWTRNILRNTLPALIPMIARNITLVFAFSMLIENVVSWGGIGRWLVNALSVQDYQAISAGVIAIGIFVLAVDLLAALAITLLDSSQKKDWYNVK